MGENSDSVTRFLFTGKQTLGPCSVDGAVRGSMPEMLVSIGSSEKPYQNYTGKRPGIH